MPEPTILPDLPPAPVAVPPAPVPEPVRAERPEIRCEFCRSKLDRRGGLIERGPKVRELMDAEDTIAALKKQLATAIEAHDVTKGELAAAVAQLAPFKSRRFGHLVKS